MTDEFDPFKGETGLKDDYEGVITDAFFQGSEFNLNMHLKIAADDGEEVELRYGCGADWASFDGGESAEHPKGGKKGFNNQTAYFGLIKHAFESGAEDELRRRSETLYAGRGPMHAGLWKGLRFHWGVVTETGRVRTDTGQWEPREFPRSYPDKFIGVVAVDSPSNQPAPASAVLSTEGPLSTLAPPTAAAVTALAKSKPYAEWVDDVMGMSDPSGQPLVNNATLMQALGDESFYNELKGE